MSGFLPRWTTPAPPLALLACLALTLGACTDQGGKITHYLPEAAVVQQGVDCASSAPGATPSSLAGSIPEGFVTEQVFICHLMSSEVGGVVKEGFQAEELTGDFAPLLAALAIPSERGGTRNCLDYADIPPELWLVNVKSQAINVTWPLDNCEHLNPATALALATLTKTKTIPAPVTPTAKVPTS